MRTQIFSKDVKLLSLDSAKLYPRKEAVCETRVKKSLPSQNISCI